MFVVDSDRAAEQFDAIEIVDRQDSALLVLVLDEAETLEKGSSWGIGVWKHVACGRELQQCSGAIL